MINPARLHSDLSRLGRETDMFLATVSSLSDEELAAPSLCEGWTRAHVIAANAKQKPFDKSTVPFYADIPEEDTSSEPTSDGAVPEDSTQPLTG